MLPPAPPGARVRVDISEIVSSMGLLYRQVLGGFLLFYFNCRTFTNVDTWFKILKNILISAYGMTIFLLLRLQQGSSWYWADQDMLRLWQTQEKLEHLQ
jgi:hypothetical protein